MNESNFISLLGLILAISAFVSGYLQYIKAQKWKRAEFAVKEIKEYENKENIRFAMKMLDWNNTEYVIKGIKTIINDEKLADSLREHDKLNNFDSTEIFIRECFDDYFISLERYNHYIESNLVTSQEFKPYLNYWLDIIGNKDNNRKPKECREAILNYLKIYNYAGVIDLLSRYGYNHS